MNALLSLLLVSGISGGPSPSDARQQVDLIELNHFFDEFGRHVFDQVIFYEWSPEHSRFHVKAWRLVKDPQQLPQRSWKPAQYRCTWMDDGIRRVVTSAAFRETWSQVDPERANRKLLSQDQRTGLMTPVRPEDRP